MEQEKETTAKPESVDTFLAVMPKDGGCNGGLQRVSLGLSARLSRLGWQGGEVVVVEANQNRIAISRLRKKSANAGGEPR
ncbi:MAG: hypothetical protein ABII00_14720 [Elusimicrobiota bacterium]